LWCGAGAGGEGEPRARGGGVGLGYAVATRNKAYPGIDSTLDREDHYNT